MLIRSRLIQTSAQALLVLLATAVGVYSLRYAIPHVPAPAPLTNVTTQHVALCVHAVFAALALLVGPWQFITAIRARHRQLHRALGWCYALAVLFGWIASLPIALHAQTGPIAAAGFLALGMCWITSTGTAIWKITHGDPMGHRRWMIRSYALTSAAITLRIYLGIILGFGIPFVPGYQTIAWLCWLPNLLVAEFLLNRSGGNYWVGDQNAG